MNLSSASVSSTRPPVSVCGTGSACLELRGFSWEWASLRCRRSPGGLPYCRASPHRADLPARRSALRFNALFRQCAGVPLLRRPVAACVGNGLLTVCPSRFASRLALRPRLTLIRLALIRNPWPFGGQVSRLSCRYLCLHLLFHGLHRPSRDGFRGEWNAPLPTGIIMSVPRLRRRTYARLLSMRGRSTSELLRTLQMNGCFQANILAVCATPPRYWLQLGPNLGALAGGLSCSSLGRGP